MKPTYLRGAVIMNRKRIRVLSILAAAVVVGTFQAPSHARNIIASAGRAVVAADNSCFWLNGGSINNGCSSRKLFTIPLWLGDPAGYVSVKVNAQGASTSNTVGCHAVGTNESITAVWSSGYKWLSTYGTPESIALQPVYTPANGSLYVDCYLDPNGRVNTLHW